MSGNLFFLLQIFGQGVQLVFCRCCDWVHSLPKTLSPSSTARHSLQNLCCWAAILGQDITCSNACQTLLCWGNYKLSSGVECLLCCSRSMHVLDISMHVHMYIRILGLWNVDNKCQWVGDTISWEEQARQDRETQGRGKWKSHLFGVKQAERYIQCCIHWQQVIVIPISHRHTKHCTTVLHITCTCP